MLPFLKLDSEGYLYVKLSRKLSYSISNFMIFIPSKLKVDFQLSNIVSREEESVWTGMLVHLFDMRDICTGY